MATRARSRAGTVRIGISGWRYPAWRGVFYPKGLPQREELAFASRCFSTLEINGSFYSLLRPDAVRRWYDESPPGVVFAIKGSRFITHMKRLREPETALSNFFASGMLALKDKLGPVLWQLPPRQTFDVERLEHFFAHLPRTTRAAAELGRAHDERVRGRTYLTVDEDRPLRYALEVRHPSFETPEFVALLRRHEIALCVADTAGLFPALDDVTADFVYVRLHGDVKLYESGYSTEALRPWAAKIDAWRRTRDVYVYFDNDAKVRAPFDARALEAMVRGEEPQPLPKGLSKAGEPARTTWPDWRRSRT